VAHGRQAGDPLGQRRDKAGVLDELRSKLEQLDLVAGFGVGSDQTTAETVCHSRFRL
jgi:hypothetical protein